MPTPSSARPLRDRDVDRVRALDDRRARAALERVAVRRSRSASQN